jgi:DNA-binding NarL/FixJ family response regulator
MPSVLIVDDHAGDHGVLRRLFEGQSEFVVCGEAENGIEAVRKARELSPDLIVLDLSTPLIDGFEAAQTLKQTTPDAPVFMLVEHYTAATEREALSCGICAVFAKDDDLTCLIPNARAVCSAKDEEDGETRMK